MPEFAIYISEAIAVRENALTFNAIRAQGPGGQNVNKVSSAVQLRFDFERSDLPYYVKRKLKSSGDRRVLSSGEIIIKAQRYRTLEANKQDAIDRLRDILQEASHREKRRIATRPTKSSVRKRLDKKSKRSDLKSKRGKVSGKDY